MKITGEKRHFKKNLLAGPEVGPRTEHRIVVRSASPLEHLLSFFLSFFRSSFFICLMFFEPNQALVTYPKLVFWIRHDRRPSVFDEVTFKIRLLENVNLKKENHGIFLPQAYQDLYDLAASVDEQGPHSLPVP